MGHRLCTASHSRTPAGRLAGGSSAAIEAARMPVGGLTAPRARLTTAGLGSTYCSTPIAVAAAQWRLHLQRDPLVSAQPDRPGRANADYRR